MPIEGQTRDRDSLSHARWENGGGCSYITTGHLIEGSLAQLKRRKGGVHGEKKSREYCINAECNAVVFDHTDYRADENA